eukprot:27232-Pelagococcus_subviridis.AAC.1
MARASRASSSSSSGRMARPPPAAPVLLLSLLSLLASLPRHRADAYPTKMSKGKCGDAAHPQFAIRCVLYTGPHTTPSAW